jgi:hypothetical protein
MPVARHLRGLLFPTAAIVPEGYNIAAHINPSGSPKLIICSIKADNILPVAQGYFGQGASLNGIGGFELVGFEPADFEPAGFEPAGFELAGFELAGFDLS